MQSNSKIYNISKLNNEIKNLLEGSFGRVWVDAEISNFVAPSSGHWYFTLKDARSQIKCAMFKGKNRSVTFHPKNGQQIMVRANISVYEPRGDYQLLVDMMDVSGDGLLQQQFEQLKCQLAGQGLFSTEHKKPLPQYIKRIGIITSPTGAAIQDILSVLKRRNPLVEVVIYPCQVQGQYAAQEIVTALQVANQRNEVDLLVLTRGGGSLEDLWCFNDEQLAHEIFSSTLPIISAVGHEIDVTMSDFVADYRAPTPSAAAEVAVASTQEQGARLVHLSQRLLGFIQSDIHSGSQRFQGLYTRLVAQDPKFKLAQQAQYLDELTARLQHATSRQLVKAQQRITTLIQRLYQQSPQHTISSQRQRLIQLKIRLDQAMTQLTNNKETRLHSILRELNNVSPLATLARGYSITLDEQGEVIESAEQVTIGDMITSQLYHSKIVSVVKSAD